ncbi:G-box-binding factor 1-like [Arachis stenosperma]|uniref:G-box-binding factor 1-like n=1 Tax=Arachis stenosperma TaxID=217475 RepID=UPI0025AD0C2A|nr:G-box-binding factor 1-like [Arachis stenosperma]
MLANGANAQNNAITQSSGKAAVSMAATNLNIGMDLWNASSAKADATKLRNNQPAPGAVNPPTIMGREDERDLKRQKRKQSNRESARRSRLRKQAECEELQRKVESLGNESQTLREELQIIMSSNNTFAVNSQQKELERLCGPEAVASLE